MLPYKHSIFSYPLKILPERVFSADHFCCFRAGLAHFRASLAAAVSFIDK